MRRLTLCWQEEPEQWGMCMCLAASSGSRFCFWTFSLLLRCPNDRDRILLKYKPKQNKPVTSWAVSGRCRSSATTVSEDVWKDSGTGDLNPMVYSSLVVKTAHVFPLDGVPRERIPREFRYRAWWIGCRQRGCDSTLREGGCNLIKPFCISGLTWGRSLFPFERPLGSGSILEASMCWHWQTSPRIDYMCLILPGKLRKWNALAASTSCKPDSKGRKEDVQ